MKYPITSIFRSLQGEGHFVGYPTTFVRFAGCSVLGCSIRAQCDEAPWKATEELDEIGIVARVSGFVHGLTHGEIVCLTGGEPTDHDLIPVVDELTRAGCRVHLETSGVRSTAGWPLEWITVSPKTDDYVQRTGETLKLVVRPGMTWDDIRPFDVQTSFFHRYLQPLYGADGNPINLPEVVELLHSPWNYRARWALSTQAHKTWGMP